MTARSVLHGRRTAGRKSAGGQSLVEFALVLPIFLLMMFGVIDAGRYVFANSAVSNAAREGARLGSVEASWMGSGDASCGTAGGPICPVDFNALKAHIKSAANRQMTPFGSVTNVYINCVSSAGTPPTGAWTSSSCAANKYGGFISVRVTYVWDAITPMIGNIMGSITTTASATVTIN
jgi:Flp pilus assembly protein TadG